MFQEFNCACCDKPVRRKVVKSRQTERRFCSMGCKAEWQRTQKPVDREWLYQKYIVERLDCTQISKLVKRNSKRVWEWLRDYGIETRSRGKTGNGRHPKGIPGKPLSAETKEKIRQASLRDGRVPYLRNGVHHLKGKRGAATPNWRGGVTPERQNAYGSLEWKAAVKAIWKRDNATCQRCGLHRSQARKQDVDFDIHHIVSFAVEHLRYEVSNLVLLCEPCHYWVHSSANINKEFIREYQCIESS